MKIMNTRPLSAIPSKMVYILLMLTAMLTACVANDDNGNIGKLTDAECAALIVVTAKNAFTHNDNVKEILREAAQVGGMPKTGSYTIVWRQTDAGINSDKEEFVVNY